MSATMTPPPMMLPRVTGNRLAKNPLQESCSEPLTTIWSFKRIPKGMKYMLAMLCSKPAATKAEIGKTTARILSATLRPARASQTARQTRMLQRIPLKKASQKGSVTFTFAASRLLGGEGDLSIAGDQD